MANTVDENKKKGNPEQNPNANEPSDADQNAALNNAQNATQSAKVPFWKKISNGWKKFNTNHPVLSGVLKTGACIAIGAAGKTAWDAAHSGGNNVNDCDDDSDDGEYMVEAPDDEE